jgi:hypothetical protein
MDEIAGQLFPRERAEVERPADAEAGGSHDGGIVAPGDGLDLVS